MTPNVRGVPVDVQTRCAHCSSPLDVSHQDEVLWACYWPVGIAKMLLKYPRRGKSQARSRDQAI